METIHPLSIKDFFNLYADNENLFNAMPEFNFMLGLAKKIKEQKCGCGLNTEIAQAERKFNEIVQCFNEETVDRISNLLKREKLCFGIQSAGNFEIKCYEPPKSNVE